DLFSTADVDTGIVLAADVESGSPVSTVPDSLTARITPDGPPDWDSLVDNSPATLNFTTDGTVGTDVPIADSLAAATSSVTLNITDSAADSLTFPIFPSFSTLSPLQSLLNAAMPALEDECRRRRAPTFASFPQRARAAMLTYHSVAPLVGQTLAGNFVDDAEMFRATGASLALQGEDYGASSSSSVMVVTPRSQGNRRLGIVNRFEFVHGSAYMTLHSQLPSHFSSAQAQPMAWTQVEAGARLLGLCLFRNELKDDVDEALGDMRDTGCRVVMITGDSVDTGVAVAPCCGMIRGTEAGCPRCAGRVVWREARDAVGAAAAAEGDGAEVVADAELERMLDTGRRGLPACGCTWRTVTAMRCDGGNDTGALKAAHAGIALSEAESSVVLHFSSRDRRLGGVRGAAA
ncbi:hypothetical protein HK405_001950, partial [Cladochytrium tenue]